MTTTWNSAQAGAFEWVTDRERDPSDVPYYFGRDVHPADARSVSVGYAFSMGPYYLVTDGPTLLTTFMNGNRFPLMKADAYAALFFHYAHKIEDGYVHDPNLPQSERDANLTLSRFSSEFMILPSGERAPIPARRT